MNRTKQTGFKIRCHYRMADSPTELGASACSALVEVAANAMQTKVREAHVIRINDGPWLDFEATHNLGKSLGFGGYLNILEWLVDKYGVPFKGVVHWPNDKDQAQPYHQNQTSKT